MKILWITEFFPETAAGEITGGVEARCFFVSKHLKQKSHQVRVIYRTEGTDWDYASLTSLPKRLAFAIRAITQALQEDFDLIEGTNYLTHGLARLVGLLKGKPVVYWYPDVFIGKWKDNTGGAGLLGEMVERLNLLIPPTKFIAISQSTKNKLLSIGVPEKKISVVYCGIEPDEISKIKLGQKKYDLCCVNRLVSYKRTEDLINALPILVKKFPKLSLAIVGQGPEKEKLMKLTEKLSLQNNIHFLGHVAKHSEVLRTIAASKVFCLPSVVEGFGIVIVESAALRVPYVASDIPVIREVTQGGQGGLLFTPQNPLDLARNIIKLLNTPALYQQKRLEGLKLSKNYTWQKIADETEKQYENLLND